MRMAVIAARAVIDERRAELRGGATGEVDLLARARERVARIERRSPRPVLNATGVIVHTNLGRAPLAADAQAAVARIAGGYSNLEWDVESGTRGSRHDHVAALLAELTGAEAAMAVNNCAAAVLLAAAALAGPGRDIVVSRGQLVEIGGGFRIPEVVAQAGARLVEVGTTNRTRRADYERAIGPDTGAILRAHPSNFRQLGFVQEVEIEELCELGVPVIDDVGSGNLAEDLPALADEPPVRRSVAAGAALVCFSGDKLLGGPQAGLLVGRADAIAAARAHPLARALRLDKLSLAALEATLALYRDPERARAEIPVLAMLTADEPALAERARRLADGHRRGRRDRRGRPRRSAAARCRCSSCPARSWRSAARRTSSPRGCGRRIRPSSGGSRTGACCSTRARWPRTTSTWWRGRSAQRSTVDARPALLSNRLVPKYDAFGREIGEDTFSGLGSGASDNASARGRGGADGGRVAAARPGAAALHAAGAAPAAAGLHRRAPGAPAAPAPAPVRPEPDAPAPEAPQRARGRSSWC